MDILVIGNGFDLAHGLDTRYSDFLKYYKEKYSTTKSVGVDKTDNFLHNNVWAKHFLNQTLSGDKWIDLENEIYNVIVKLSELPYFRNCISYEKYPEITFFIAKDYWKFNFDEVGNYFREPGFICSSDCYNVQIKDFINFLYNQLRDFVKEFENYLLEESKKIENTQKYDLRINKDCVSLLNFNYTDTCEQLYKINFDYNTCGIKTKAVYVHGKIKDQTGAKLIMGTHSFDNEQIPAEFNMFRKHNQRHKYGTIESYQELLNELKHPSHGKIYTPVFHIIGHSLDKTDHNILKHVLLVNKKAKINIYYHDEESQERLINNITEIIGEEEVMSRVKLIYQHDKQRGILIEKSKDSN